MPVFQSARPNASPVCKAECLDWRADAVEIGSLEGGRRGAVFGDGVDARQFSNFRTLAIGVVDPRHKANIGHS